MLVAIVPEPTSYEEIIAEVLADGPSHGMWPDGERYHDKAEDAAKAIHERFVRTCGLWKKFAEALRK